MAIDDDDKFDAKENFDNRLLETDDIQYIERVTINNVYTDISCDRCHHKGLIYINLLRINDRYYNVGDNCYNDNIKIILAKKWGISLVLVRLRLNEPCNRYQEYKHVIDKAELDENKPLKHDLDYKIYEALKWDYENGHLPPKKIEEYNRLKEKFKNL